MSAVMSYGVKPPTTRRINYRILITAAVFAVLIGVPVYNFVRTQMNHGIEVSGDRVNVDLKRLGNFPFNDVKGTLNEVPADFRALDGKKVALEGFMYSGTRSGAKVDKFQFVYNVSKCCFNGPPLVQERVFAYVPNHADVDYYAEEVRIVGTLHVKLHRDSYGKVDELYTIDVNNVEQI